LFSLAGCGRAFAEPDFTCGDLIVKIPFLKITLVSLPLWPLAACGASEASWPYAMALSDGAGTAYYDCQPLEGTEADLALAKSHALFESKHYPQFRAQRAQTLQTLSERTLTQADIAKINKKANALTARAAADTAALGCTYKDLTVKKGR
jgi:hypothetical protein